MTNKEACISMLYKENAMQEKNRYGFSFLFPFSEYQCGFPHNSPPKQKAKVYAFALLSPLFVLTNRLIPFFYNFQCIRIESTIMKFTKLANHRIRHKLLVALIIKLLLLPNLI